MDGEAKREHLGASRARAVALVAIAAAALGVLATWTDDGAVALSGLQGPNNGWLVLIVAAFALGWTGPMVRGSWVGVAGVVGSAFVMGLTAVENWLDSRAALGASARLGLVLVVVASVALGVVALGRAAELALGRRPV